VLNARKSLKMNLESW